jgi:hypothetical protein
VTSSVDEPTSPEPTEAGTDELEAARTRQQELLAQYHRLFEEASEKCGPKALSSGEAMRNRVLMAGIPLAFAAATFYATDSWLWAIGALVGGLIGVVALMLIIFPDTTPRPGTLGFEAEQEVMLIHRFMTQVLEQPLDNHDLASLESTNGALEHYSEQLRQRIPNLGSMEQGEGVISVDRYEGR